MSRSLQTFKPIRAQAGFNLVELILVFIVIGFAAQWAYETYVGVSTDVTAEQEKSDIIQYASKTQKKYHVSADYTGATIAVLVTNGVFPNSLVSGTTVKNKYGGTVSLAVQSINTPADSVQFTTTNYPISACREVVPKIEPGMYSIAVNGTPVKAGGGQLDLSALGNACTTSPNSIAFVVTK